MQRKTSKKWVDFILCCWNILKEKSSRRKIDWLIVAFEFNSLLYCTGMYYPPPPQCVSVLSDLHHLLLNLVPLYGSLSAIPQDRVVNSQYGTQPQQYHPMYPPHYDGVGIPCSVLCKRRFSEKVYTRGPTCSSATLCTRTQKDTNKWKVTIQWLHTQLSQTFIQQSFEFFLLLLM